MENIMDVNERLDALRALMKERGISAYIIPTEDFHGSEYVGEYFKAREYMSGFTGSAGTLVVLQDGAALWTDGRYFIQAAKQLAGSPITLMRMGQTGVPSIEEYLSGQLGEESVIGFDGRTVTHRFVESVAEKAGDRQITFRGDEDLVDLVWKDRPPMSMEPVWELAIGYAGRSREEKLCDVRGQMREQKADVLLLTALDDIAWLLNLRGNDVAYTPVFLSYMILTQTQATLCVHKQILPEEISRRLTQAGIDIAAYEEIEQRLRDIPAGSSVWVDCGSVSDRLVKDIPDTAEKIDKRSPIALMKAVKTSEEMEHMRAAHVKDGVAVTRFMRWLKTSVDRTADNVAAGGEKMTEISAVERLEAFRAQMEGYLGPSFEPIIAYGAHGAIVHYEPTQQTDVEMAGGSFCLADTGGHYREGTTDITRTIALGTVSEEEKRYYTLALRGHLAFGAARFVQGVCGQNLDVLARMPLWEAGLDYNHGTGHGVGYLLSVHEGPQRVHWRILATTQSVPLEEGMVVSNEPGIYVEGRFGIRHENLVLCRKAEETEYGQFLYFEPLTMVPFDREAILPELMSERELQWLNDYHDRVYETLSPYFTGEESEWLREATAKIGR